MKGKGMRTAAKGRDLDVPVSAASGKFKGYATQNETAIREQDVKEDRILKEIKGAWVKLGSLWVNDTVGGFRMAEWAKRYEETLQAISGIECSPKDIEALSLAIGEFQQEREFGTKAGYIISALIENGCGDEFKVHTAQLEKKIHYLGFRNSKTIIIDGDAGMGVGSQMEKGKITVNGNCGMNAGYGM